MKAKEVGSGPWGTPQSELEKDYYDRIETSYRSIQASSLSDANKYMEENYQGEKYSLFHDIYETSVRPSHGSISSKDGNRIYFYIITRKILKHV